MTYDEIVEKIARAWASMDGKTAHFDRGKADPDYDRDIGHFMGYIEEAKELIKRSGIKQYLKLSGENENE